MANRVIEYIIRAKDKTGEGVNSALDKLRDMRKSTKATGDAADAAGGRIGAGIGRGATGISFLTKGIAGLVGALGALAFAGRFMYSAMSKAFEFERYSTQFRVLLGSLDAAEARIKSLAAFSANAQFKLPDVIQASKQLNVLSGGLLDTETNMTLVGDAASIAGSGISDVAMLFGRAYSAIRAGRPFGDAAGRLQEMGLLSGKAREKMEDLQRSGASAASVFSVLQNELARFSGGMKDASATGEGLKKAVGENLTQAMAAFGKGAAEAAKGPMADLIEKMGELQEAGKFEDWGNNLIRKLEFAIGLAEHMNTIINPAQIIADTGYDIGAMVYGLNKDKSDEDYAQDARRVKLTNDRAKEAAAAKAEIDNAKLAADLDAADQERKAKAQGKLDILGVVNPFAEQARLQIETEQASKRGKLLAGREASRDGTGKAGLDVSDELGLLNRDSAAGMDAFVKEVAARAEKLQASAAAEEKSANKEAAADAKRQAKATKAAQERLSTEAKQYELGKMAPADAQATISAEIEKLTREISGGKLSPLAEAEKGLELLNKKRSLDSMQETSLGSGVKDFFLAGYGQESSENKIERNTGEMVEILKRMEKEAGLAE